MNHRRFAEHKSRKKKPPVCSGTTLRLPQGLCYESGKFGWSRKHPGVSPCHPRGCSLGLPQTTPIVPEGDRQSRGTVFVFIEHQSLTEKSALTEILARATGMAVREIDGHTAVHPDHVYVLPPRMDLGIFHGILTPIPYRASPEHHTPIDYFLTSLALDRATKPSACCFPGREPTAARAAKRSKPGAARPLSRNPDRRPSAACRARLLPPTRWIASCPWRKSSARSGVWAGPALGPPWKTWTKACGGSSCCYGRRPAPISARTSPPPSGGASAGAWPCAG